MTVRLENIEQEPSDSPENAPHEPVEEAPIPKKRGRPLGSKDKQKRAQRASTTYNPLEPEPEVPIVKKRGRPLGAKDKTKRAPRGGTVSSAPESPPESPPDPPGPVNPPPAPPAPISYQEQRRAYLQQMDQARAADFNERAQRFGALLAKTLPY